MLGYCIGGPFIWNLIKCAPKRVVAAVLTLPSGFRPELPDYAVAMESAMLAPSAQVSLYPWKDVPEKIPLAVRHIRKFLKANRPAVAAMEQRAAAD